MDLDRDTVGVLAEHISPDSSVISVWPLEGGVSANMFAIELKTADGNARKVVVRQHGAADWKELVDNVTAIEFQLLKTLYGYGIKVPEPLYIDNSGTVLPSPFFVSKYVEGSSEISSSQLAGCLQQMATFLSELHGLDTHAIDLPNLPMIEDPVKGALQYLPQVSQDKQPLAIIEKMSLDTKRLCLLHGDFWPGNLLWSNGNLVAVVDWEDATLGNPMSDLACGRVELFVKYGAEAMGLFTECYGLDDVNSPDLLVWEIYSASAALATLSNWGLPEDVEERRRVMTRQFLDSALARLELCS